jgi:hypothetical protein
MDCATARLLLECSGRHAAELDAAEAEALERHLAGCADCAARAGAERHCDEALGRAMRQVEVPPGLRRQLLDRLEKDRAQWRRHRWVQLARLTAAAAALVLLAWGAWYWLANSSAPLQPEYVWQQANRTPIGKAEVEQTFRRLDAPAAAPDLNYAWLTFRGLGEVPGYPGRVVPVLLFHRQVQEAAVYVLDTRRFGLPPQAGEYESQSGQRLQLSILGQDGNPYRDGERFAYLVLHNGGDLDWLRPAEPPAT